MIDVARMDDVLRRGGDVSDLVERFRAADAKRKELQASLDELRARRNAANKTMAKADKGSEEFSKARDDLRALSGEIKRGEGTLGELVDEVRGTHMVIPNAPHTSVPDGAGEDDNTVTRTWGDKPEYDFEAQAHWDLGERLGILDFEAGAKLSGSRFTVLRGHGARLNRALISFMADLHVGRGYTEIYPPALIKRECMEGTGQLPKFEDDAFKTLGEHELFLSPTAEVQVTNLHRNEILEPGSLPRKYCAYAPCFRAEAGSHGKDTRGLIRQHQFEKVELVKFVEPETSYDELEGLLGDAEHVLQTLGLHYRVVTLCLGDVSFTAAKTYDIEVWLPGQNAYREISSCSNFEDFQARRAKIRYRKAKGEKPRMVHTLNGSGLAVGRTIVAVMEQYQRADGSIEVPEKLRPYMGGIEVLTAA
jgi:seryl-tRNA synthetase